MGMLKEFKGFIMKGNVLDLAVAVVIGAAFKAVITSFVKDVLMPPIGLLLGDTDFSNLKVILKEGTEAVVQGEQVVTPAVQEVAVSYGAFTNTVIDFIIIAFVIFMIVKGYNKSQKKKEEAPKAPPAPTNEEVLLSEIRDILKENK
jgi:large conductance mechanosensitive channel